MKTVYKHVYIILTLLILVFATESSAAARTVSEETIVDSDALFQCSILARYAKLADAQKRLFSHGYDKGKVAVKAIRKESTLNKSSAGNSLAQLFNFGVGDDFILGIIYWKSTERVSRFLLENTPDTDGNIALDEAFQPIAKREFYKRNCRLILK